MKIVLDVLALSVLAVIKVIGIDSGKLGARVGDLDLGFPHLGPVGIPFVLHVEITQPTDNEGHVLWVPFQILGQLGMEANESFLVKIPPPHLCIPFALHPYEADTGQLLALDGGLDLAHEAIIEVTRLGRLLPFRVMPCLPPSMDGLSAESILNDDDPGLAKCLFNGRGKGLLRAVALHIGLPGKDEQVLGVMLRLGEDAQEERGNEKCG